MQIADTRGFNLSREKVKFLFDYGIFGIPVTPPIGDRSSSQILGYFDLDIGGVNSGSSPPGDHTQSFELYRTKLLKKTKVGSLLLACSMLTGQQRMDPMTIASL